MCEYTDKFHMTVEENIFLAKRKEVLMPLSVTTTQTILWKLQRRLYIIIA